MSKRRVIVRAQVVVDVVVGAWSGSETFNDLHPKVVEEARTIIENSYRNSATRIVGEPKITMITMDEE